MPTINELNAAYDKAFADVSNLIDQIPVLQDAARQHLESEDGRRTLLRIVRGVLEAAERVRAKKG